MAHGSLMGARGNSGVILSQLLRGISRDVRDLRGRCRGSGVDGPALAEALVAASDAAQKAVLRPVEGTILTVAREAGVGAKIAADSGAALVGVAEQAREQAARGSCADTRACFRCSPAPGSSTPAGPDTCCYSTRF